MGPPTIHDVARLAGVSIATVSKVINQRPGVAVATAERVLAAVEGLGYEPSMIAQRMRGGGSGVVGVVTAGLDAWAGEVLKGVSAAAAGTGYGTLVAVGDGTANAWTWERRTLARLRGHLIDGAILVAPTGGPLVRDLPVVVVAPPGRGSGLPEGPPVRSPLTLVSDRPAEAGAEALRLLLAQVRLVDRHPPEGAPLRAMPRASAG
ncbi:MAG: LacI family transcriptional regulator [Actinomycetales bacterium]|nr:LacI family transcriptional regulator [Actinomycetales bacterium]